MRYEEWEGFDSTELGIAEEFKVTNFGGECSVNGFVALAVNYFSPRYLVNEIYEISIQTQSAGKAYLLTCEGQPFDFQIASEFFACAFLKDVAKEDLEGPKSSMYNFKSSYVVIESTLLAEYNNFYNTSSAIWGGFSDASVSHVSHKIPPNQPILALPNIDLPTASHHDVVVRANKDFSILGRYLALYQLIELSFDYDLVEDIKRLGQDLRNIGKVLAQYNHTETVRLNRLIAKYWNDENTLLDALGQFFTASAYDAEIEDLLFGYEKDGFPWNLKTDAAKRSAFLVQARVSLDKQSMTKVKCSYTLEELQKAVGYIIYRFRCAIAHASIGEYIITLDDEQFVHEKAEPLLMRLIFEMYKK
jgi:hypothetical protein